MRYQRVLLALIMIPTIGLALGGCRSKIKTKSSNGGAMPAEDGPEDLPPILCEDGNPAAADGSCASEDDPVDPNVVEDGGAAEAIENPDALRLDGDKLYFQTRDIITIRVKKDMVAGGNTLTITNANKEDGSDKVNTLVEETPVDSFGLSHDGSFKLVDAGDDLLWYFYPGESTWDGKFFYGKNYIKVYVDDDEQPVYSITELTLKDFEIFGVAVTSFGGEFKDMQVAREDGPEGFQFQGWVNVLSPPSVKSGDTVLTNGMFNIVNPQ